MSANDTSTIFVHDLTAAHPSKTIGVTILEDLFQNDEMDKETVKIQTGSGVSTIALGEAQLRKMHDATERFSYENPLGEGAYGKVWKAQDIDIGRSVAIKSYKYGGEVGHRLLSMETNIAGKIDHPNVPVLYDIKKTEDEQYHYIMKFIEGESLEAIIERLRAGDKETLAKYSFEKRASIITQILRVLAASHKKNILHRDIKAENIMVGPAGEAYLMDWGVALDLNQFNGKGQLAGSPRYMSPEQAAQKALDQRSDLYSIIAVFFELMSLKQHGPDVKTADEVLKAIPEFEPSFKLIAMPHSQYGTYPMQYQSIFFKGLKNNPDERYQSAEEILEQLDASMSGDIEVGCHVSLMFKSFYLIRQGMTQHPILSNLALLFVPLAFMGLLVYIGTLL